MGLMLTAALLLLVLSMRKFGMDAAPTWETRACLLIWTLSAKSPTRESDQPG